MTRRTLALVAGRIVGVTTHSRKGEYGLTVTHLEVDVTGLAEDVREDLRRRLSQGKPVTVEISTIEPELNLPQAAEREEAS